VLRLKSKSKSASKEEVARRHAGLYVVVQFVPGADPEQFVGKPRPRDEALTVFSGVLRHVPTDYFAPDSGARLRVVSVADWNKSRLAEALLES
jgi:hypothetical protein